VVTLKTVQQMGYIGPAVCDRSVVSTTFLSSFLLYQLSSHLRIVFAPPVALWGGPKMAVLVLSLFCCVFGISRDVIDITLCVFSNIYFVGST